MILSNNVNQNGEDDPFIGKCYHFIGSVYWSQIKLELALEYFSKAIEILQQSENQKISLPLLIII